ncbi:thiamine phosphate synthase [Parasphingorhabdus cellanae]|uniref:Thiamine phosphate synthase n=1 Tax=Parasphingorhabdus cellanae TaxID=2806553 RepID=A0ABX7T3V4_9SPHN|nr:thiamine phosphate synthase [Parasphingorhabdus cellanae]QTD54762.1 thiamine phosphate synthase [Parasphingorhabdus cellanae]
MHHPCFSDLYPQVWLMTDQRNDAALEKSIANLPRGSGIIFRHYHLDKDARYKRFQSIRNCARRGDHILSLADAPALAQQWGADGVHGRQWKRHKTGDLLHSAPVHNPREIMTAKHGGADLLFLSPAFATRSHPDQTPMGHMQLKHLIALCDKPVILLGGMNMKRFQQREHLGAHGWAAIDALST